MASGGMEEKQRCVRVLCPSKISTFSRDPGLYWLVGSPRFLLPFTVVSALRCLHSPPGDPYSPDYTKEADDLRTLLLRGFDIVGALSVGNNNWEGNARQAVDALLKLKRLLFNEEIGYDIVGAAADSTTADIQFFASKPGSTSTLEAFDIVVYEDNPEKFVWENGCLLRCQLEFKLPGYVPVNKTTDVEKVLFSATDAVVAKLRDPQIVYLVEGTYKEHQSVVLHGAELNSNTDIPDHYPPGNKASESGRNTLPCSYFFTESKEFSSINAKESADAIRVTIFSNLSGNTKNSSAPIAEYLPASVSASLINVNFKIDVLCYSSKEFPVSAAISRLVIPGIVDQVAMLNKAICPKVLSQQPQLCPYHFYPPGILHPITVIHELGYGETEMMQAEIRRSLHLRLGLPLDRPLLLIANALPFGSEDIRARSSRKTGSVIKNVHVDIPRSGVSGGLVSLVEGSYEYYHYLQDGFDDSGWGCAYRSLQTIISWFRLQHYTSVQVPSHREIQQALVDIGDKEPSFVGSHEWIGAIELSFVLDKLLGVSCKIINVRSGDELPEKCRELALHFENQGTPVMIGGGVLAYTLLGVDYNEVSGDCAFLILDPHYTGSDENKKIVNGGWCGWKKAVDSKGKHFFLHDKFYNLLLPQRPNMV